MEVERLGLRTYNQGSNFTRPKFKSDAVCRMYWQDLQRLFGILCRDEGSILSRDDPNLFDTELTSLLEEYGSVVWPVPEEGNRDHLRMPQTDTLYTEDLVYPRDTAM
jgi:hypothetical protein